MERLLADPANPLLTRAYQERYFPGSTFKVVTAAAGLESGLVTPENAVVPGHRRVHAAPHDPSDQQLQRRHLRRHC